MELRRVEHLPEILERASGKARLDIEIGCGTGHFIATYAEKYPDCFFIGVELKKERCLKIVKKSERARIENIEIVYGRAQELVAALTPESVDTFHIYFPDPWPKTRHRKHRLFKKPMLDVLAKAMKPGGRLIFVTDFFDYSVQAKLLLILQNGFELVERDPPGEVFLSVFANRFTDAKKPIYYVSAMKAAPAG